MAKRFEDMVSTLQSEVVLRHGDRNRTWLEGLGEAPWLGGTNPLWGRLGRWMTWLFLAAAAALVAIGLYIYAWNSPLVAETEATILSADYGKGGRHMVYSYQVEGETFEKTQVQNRRFATAWDHPGAKETIVYFKAYPSVASLDFLVEPMDWFTFVGGTLFMLALAYAGVLMRRESRRLIEIQERATHVLPGRVAAIIPTKGAKNVVYEFQPPGGGKPLRGSVLIGNLERVGAQMAEGTPLAVIYADETHHTLL